MNFDTLSMVKFGNTEELNAFLFENGMQHQLFRDTIMDTGITMPAFPLMDADTSNLDDWLMAHQVEHQAFASVLGLENPINLLDVDFNNENDFYEWLADHLYTHQLIVAQLGLS